ncbi:MULTISPECIES: aspartate aminotransferase family protein [Mycobacteriaceae]|uniref:Aspartate aminotransferase family protein n=1 Tax=Mycolicibacterium parafortuitum TaxID=39692 RepID=A0ACC6MPW0_MYCPF|nr:MULTISPECIES: aspartate aminotransferase family protein [Mycobacteriaceae]MBX7455828.1 aspartate aminotransferase family protein [Mycolicibacterium aurantiacum]MDZ5088999.1 aspartate aminotransferase family protein [Mycolicibacterium parafortuitum]GFM21335.1 adenosylmethionine-8-amino-7-oxononanoate aminotransferase [Mycobacterium sp. PO1]GFM26787.1 adenosylmethionine-8-amino-7-oxononanoate aminotransferase [Mycobacterium sp. PO2]
MTTTFEALPTGEDLDTAIARGQRAYELDRKHVFHSWSAQAQIKPMTVLAAQGSYLWDGDGNRLLDFSSQLVNTNIGHQHPKVVAAIAEQAAKLCTIAPQHVNDARSEAARLVAERTPGDLNRIFFTNGGADAVEHAVRMARLHTGRYKVLSRYRSYHGGTDTAINLTGDPRRWPNDYASSGVVHFNGPFLYRSTFHSENEQQETQRALEHLERLIQMEGPDSFAAIILESVPGTAGIMVPPPGYLAGVREICDRYGIVFIADEVMAGFGRTGKWFAIDNFDVVPDLITFAKGVTSGYIPLGGVAINEAIYSTFADRAYPGGLTYSGHPLATACAVATITAMDDEGMVDNAARIGKDVLGPGLRELAARHRSVGEVRGLGVFWAIELVADQKTREPLAPYGGSSPAMAAVLAACKSGGLLPFANFNRIHAVPPCNVTDDEVAEGLRILDTALTVADEHAV